MLWIQGGFCLPYRFNFDDFANEVLPLSRAEVVSIRAARAKRKAADKADRPSSSKVRDWASYGEAVFEDLERLRLHRHKDGIIPPGERDAWLFCASMALAWSCHAQALEAEIVQIASKATGWPPHDARRQMGAVIRRAHDAAAGNRIRYGGRDLDPRYKMKAATIVRWLGIKPEEQRAAGLRLLLDDAARRERKARLERERRQRRGANSHENLRAARLQIGHAALYRMAKEGLSRDELAAELGVSTGYLSKAIREARAVPR